MKKQQRILLIGIMLIIITISFLAGVYCTILTQTPTRVTEEYESTRAIYIEIFGQEHEYILEEE